MCYEYEAHAKSHVRYEHVRYDYEHVRYAKHGRYECTQKHVRATGNPLGSARYEYEPCAENHVRYKYEPRTENHVRYEYKPCTEPRVTSMRLTLRATCVTSTCVTSTRALRVRTSH